MLYYLLGTICFLIIVAILWIGVFGYLRITRSPKKSPERCFQIGKRRNLYSYEEFAKINKRDIEIESHDGLKLRGFYLEPFPEEKRVIVIVHGYTVSYPWSLQFAPLFIDQRYNLLIIDQRAHGRSEGSITTYGKNEKFDILRWVEWIHQNIAENCLIGFHGQSLGGATILEYSRLAKTPIPFMIVDCAFSDFSQLIRYQIKNLYKAPVFIFYPLISGLVKLFAGFHFSECKPLKAVEESEFPILFIHGGNDRFIPTYMSSELYKAKVKGHKSLITIPNAGHGNSYPRNRQLYEKAVKSFLENVESENRLEEITS